MPLSETLHEWTDKVRFYFQMDKRNTNFVTEIRGGLTTFLTLAYILPVNASILSLSGGPCECLEGPGCQFIPDSPDGIQYAQCVEAIRLQLITTTALASMFSCIGMGVFANLPFALAPGLGLNAYFTYDVVGFKGTGDIPWRTAITAILVEGIIFFILTITGVRQFLTKSIPTPIKSAVTGGIGLFLAIIGLTTAEGIGLVVSDIATGLTLGGCPPEDRNPVYFCPEHELPETDLLSLSGGSIIFTGENFGPNNTAFENCLSEPTSTYTCDTYGGQMTSATTWLGIFAIGLMSILLARKIPGAVLSGIVLITALSWFKNTPFSFFEEDVQPGGEARFEYFKQVVKIEGIDRIGAQFDFDKFNTAELWVAVITFLYVDILDTSGTLFAMANFAGLMRPDGDFDGSRQAFLVDSVATMFGALLGTSTVTTFIESGAGIEEGARTGFASVVTGLCFFISIFFAPIIASVPPWATGPALVIVGATMMRGLVDIEWKRIEIAIPCFFAIILMPFTYSIANGIIGGLGFYIGINGILFVLEKAFGPVKEKELPVFETKEEKVNEDIKPRGESIEFEGQNDTL